MRNIYIYIIGGSLFIKNGKLNSLIKKESFKIFVTEISWWVGIELWCWAKYDKDVAVSIRQVAKYVWIS